MFPSIKRAHLLAFIAAKKGIPHFPCRIRIDIALGFNSEIRETSRDIEVKRSLPLDALIQADLTQAEQILNQAEELASERDFEIKTDLIQSREAGAAIVDEAMEKDIDLIIMGIEYKKRFGRFSAGAAVSHVLEEAPCRVIVLRRPIPGGGQ